MYTKAEFIVRECIGKGGYSRVYRAMLENSERQLASKEMIKARITCKQAVAFVFSERNILQDLNQHPFIVKIWFAFQDKDYIYLVLDYISGGDLRYQFSFAQVVF